MTTTFGKQPQPNHALAPSSPRARSQEKPAPRWWREAALVTTIYVAYDASRGLHRGNVHTATSNGTSVYRLERTAHLDPETWLNHGLHSLPALAVAAAYFYATLHFIVTPAVLVWMYRAHPNEYRRARTWLATATVSALAGFWLFPVAPPRLLHNSAIHDTLADVQTWGWWSAHSAAPNGLGSLVNEYAAMPSLHVGWAVWSGWLLLRHARRRWVQALGAVYPVLTTLVVMGTGNHYFFDAVAGAALIGVTGLITHRWQRKKGF